MSRALSCAASVCTPPLSLSPHLPQSHLLLLMFQKSAPNNPKQQVYTRFSLQLVLSRIMELRSQWVKPIQQGEQSMQERR